MNARMRFLAVGFWLFAVGLLFAQNSRFELFLRSTSNTAVTGASVYIVHMTTGDSLLLTEVSGKNGYYRRDDVTFGNYKIYVNGSLSTTQKFHPTDRIYLTLTGIDADGDYLIDTDGVVKTGGIGDGQVTLPKLSSTVQTLLSGTPSNAYNVDDVTLALEVDGSDTTFVVKGKGIGEAQLQDTFNVAQDTTKLKLKSGIDGKQIFLKQLSSGNTNGGGMFVYADSGATDTNLGISRFASATAGKHWVRQEVKDNANYRSAAWGTLQQVYDDLPASGGTIFLPPGRHDVGTGLQFVKGKTVALVGDDRWQRYRSSTGVSDYPIDAPIIYSSQSAQYIIDFNDGAFNNGYGFVFRNLVFEIDYAACDAVINGRSVNMSTVERCMFWGTESANIDSLYAIRPYVDDAVGNDASWWRVVDNTVLRMNLFYAGVEGESDNANNHVIENNICFNFTTSLTDALACIKMVFPHRSVVRNNNIEGYRIGTHLERGWSTQVVGNGGESTRKFVLTEGTTKGCYFNDLGISSPTAASGDTLYIVGAGATGNTFVIAPANREAQGIYDTRKAIRFRSGDPGFNTVIGSTVYYPSRIESPDVTNMSPFYMYPAINGLKYFDQLEGIEPDTVEYWNGSAWADWSGSEDFVEATLHTTDYVSVDETHKQIKLVYPLVSGYPSTLLVSHGQTGGTYSGTVTVEYLATEVVTSTATDTFVSAAGGAFSLDVGALSDAVDQVRLTFNYVVGSGQTVRVASIQLLSWNIYRENFTRKKHILGEGTPVSFVTGSYGDIYSDITQASGFPLWVNEGSASKTTWIPLQTIDSGSSLPTAASGLRGKQFLKTAGAGVKDSLFQCIKNSGDIYEWEYLGQ